MVGSEIHVQVRWRHAGAVHSIIVRSIRGGDREFVAEAEAGSFARAEDDKFAREQMQTELDIVWAAPTDDDPIEDATLMTAVLPEARMLYFGVDADGVPLDAFDHDDKRVEAWLRARTDLSQQAGSHVPGRPGG